MKDGINSTMKPVPRVSVIMGAYNAEKTLRRAIDSILNQSFTDWELIICDDCSRDGTYDILMEYKDKYGDKIRVLRNEKNLRLSASLNRCIEMAQGEYIARMDADDESMPQRFERQVAFLDSNPEIDCLGSSMYIFEDEKIHGLRENSQYIDVEKMKLHVPFFHPTIMMRTEVYRALGGYTVSKDTQRAEDVDLWFRFVHCGYKGYNLAEPLYKYRESSLDYKKRTLKAAIGTSKVFLRGYRLLNFSKTKYIYCLKAIFVAILPTKFIFELRKKYDVKRLELYENN